MKNHFTKISLFILIGVVFAACNSLRRVPDGKRLLTNNEISVNGERINNEDITNLLYQKPNSSILGYRLRLNLFNFANPKHDSMFKLKYIDNAEKHKRLSKWLSEKQVHRLGKSFWYSGIHEFLISTGEAPVLYDSLSATRSIKNLKAYYNNKGFFNSKTKFTIDSATTKKAKVNYIVTTGQAFEIDSIKSSILSPTLDSLYQLKKEASFIKSKKQYLTEDFEKERARITTHFRNNGAFLFQQEYIDYDIDTLVTPKKANVNLNINNYSYRENDSTKTAPFKLYKISSVNIITDYASTSKNKSIFKDSVTYKNFNLYSYNKLKYRPKAITDAVFITKGSYFSDTRTNLTSRYLSNLKVFNYPTITYKIDPTDSLSNSLIASIYLTPRKKYSFSANLDVTRSNIQELGIALSPSVTIRNVFNGAETLDIAARGNIGASKYFANPDDKFFNVLEYGLDMKLNFPRILMFFNTEKIIPKKMIPSTSITLGFSKQTNIGLDKENFTSSFAYNWTPKINSTARFELYNIQFVRNINIENYFKVYSSSYDALNTLALAYPTNPSYFSDGELLIDSGTNAFMNDVLGSNPTIFPNDKDKKAINSISERRTRLTENNLIFASNFQFSETTKKDLADESFYVFRTKLESAGNFLSLLASASKKLKNQNGNNTFLEVEYSQYFKTELEYIKHWDLSFKKIVAVRSFVGFAIPYGNSNSIPFSRSYFAGGSNDNRGWQPYSLGPGSSSGINDFNEANLKIAFNAEFRFNILGDLNGALFADAGNIWNALDNVEDEEYTFNGIKSLQDLAIGSGIGFRYDFSFFIFRLDLGFKTYNPAKLENEKWFRELNFSKSVLNIGINYPF